MISIHILLSNFHKCVNNPMLNQIIKNLDSSWRLLITFTTFIPTQHNINAFILLVPVRKNWDGKVVLPLKRYIVQLTLNLLPRSSSTLSKKLNRNSLPYFFCSFSYCFLVGRNPMNVWWIRCVRWWTYHKIY